MTSLYNKTTPDAIASGAINCKADLQHGLSYKVWGWDD